MTSCTFSKQSRSGRTQPAVARGPQPLLGRDQTTHCGCLQPGEGVYLLLVPTNASFVDENRAEEMSLAPRPASSQRQAGGGDYSSGGSSSSAQDTQDGLLPVVKFLQSALAMKAKVSSVFHSWSKQGLCGFMRERSLCDGVGREGYGGGCWHREGSSPPAQMQDGPWSHKKITLPALAAQAGAHLELNVHAFGRET